MEADYAERLLIFRGASGGIQQSGLGFRREASSTVRDAQGLLGGASATALAQRRMVGVVAR